VVPQLLGVCRRERVTIWHGHDYKSNALGLLLRRFWRMRLVTTVHGWVHFTRRTPVYYWIDRRCLPLYECVICASDDLRQRSLECGVAPERCVLIENAIDTTEYSRGLTVEEAEARLGISPGTSWLAPPAACRRKRGSTSSSAPWRHWPGTDTTSSCSSSAKGTSKPPCKA
jgi:hypothetical protein